MAIKYLAGNRIQGLSTDRQTSATATINFTKHFAMSDCSSYSSTESSTFPSNGGSFGSDQVNCYFSFASFEITEPKFLPGITFFALFFILSIVSCIFQTPIIAEAAIHLCPAQPDMEATISLDAISLLASGKTIK